MDSIYFVIWAYLTSVGISACLAYALGRLSSFYNTQDHTGWHLMANSLDGSFNKYGCDTEFWEYFIMAYITRKQGIISKFMNIHNTFS